MNMPSEMKMVKMSQLVPYARNARTHSEEQIKQIQASIREFGFVNPVIIDDNYNIIAGHGRVAAARAEGMQEVPCVFVGHLTETQKRAYILADNKLALNAGWDPELLKIEIDELHSLDFDIELTGFELEEIENIFESEEPEDSTEDEYEVNVPEEPKTKHGDIYQLGEHRLMCGDGTSADDIKTLVGDHFVDMYLTDPPYNADYEGKTKESLKMQNDSMSNDDFKKFLIDAFSAADGTMKPGAVFYIWHADAEGYNFRCACFDVGWRVRQCLIWNKNVMVMGWQDYHCKHEPCLYGWKDGAGHYWGSDKKQTTILNFDRPSRSVEHPTMKPVLLFDYLIRNNTRPGEIVLDSFGGSGTTIIACEQNGRKACCMELDPKYCDVIVNRWEKLTGKKAVLLNATA